MKALVDNDILLKGSCYDLLPALLDAVPNGGHRYGVLAAARFVVPSLIETYNVAEKVDEIQNAFQRFLAENDLLEPNQAEQTLAAELESTAQTLALNLDTGESQLAAMLTLRAVPYLITGDKRAIKALEKLVGAIPGLGVIAHRVHCLEQCVRRLIEAGDTAMIREAICAAPQVDKALSICCSCAGGQSSRDTLMLCLDGYIDELRSAAASILATE